MAAPSLTPDLRALADALCRAGFDALLVGGAVRDWLLDRPTSDFDLVTNAGPDDVRSIASGAPWCRATYAIGERFGTVGVVLADGAPVEVSRYRPDSVAAPDAAARFAIDATHRDFTVNALALDLASGELLDPLGGREDLAARLLRAPGAPAERFAEDPLRVVRAGRLAAELGFGLDGAAGEAMREAAPRLADIAVERVRDELGKLLVAPNAAAGLRLLLAAGALEVVLPEVAALDGVTQPSFHDLDVLGHTLQAVDLAPPTLVLRWATLLHDIGKGPARSVEPDGRIRFFRHAQIGAEMAERICHRLRMSNADTAAIVHLVALHMRLGEVNVNNPRSVDRAVRKLDLRVGSADPPRTLTTAEDAVELTLADFSATAHRDEAPRLREVLETAVEQSRARGTVRPTRSPLTGADLMRELHIAPGREVGVAKAAIVQAIDNGELKSNDRSTALAVARRALAASRHAGTAGSSDGSDGAAPDV